MARVTARIRRKVVVMVREARWRVFSRGVSVGRRKAGMSRLRDGEMRRRAKVARKLSWKPTLRIWGGSIRREKMRARLQMLMGLGRRPKVSEQRVRMIIS